MFPNSNSNPVDLSNLTERTILPILKEKQIEWKTLYAGRRGAATILTELTGNAIRAQWLLGHSKPETPEKFYIKQMDDVGMRGMQLLEAEIERAGELIYANDDEIMTVKDVAAFLKMSMGQIYEQTREKTRA